jgi:DNA-binding NarL/FixJ family response regulator
MARVLALVPDLLFGSNVQGSLQAAGHEVELIGEESQARELLAADRSGVLVIDMTDASFDGAAAREALAAEGLLDGVPSLAFYSHVDAETGERARAAGFDLVIPRSRMAREGPQLVARLAQEG